MSVFGRRCLETATGLVIDRLIAEPPNAVHPVAWFGTVMQRVEAVLWADRRSRGVAHVAIGLGLGAAAGRATRSTTAAVAVSVAGRALRYTASRIGAAVDAGDLHGARGELPSLVGRDPSRLGTDAICAAVIESVAENTVDAVIAPAFWAVVAGPQGAAAYRAVNTMDAMVGHRSARHTNYGWAAARLDDIANFVPARLFAAFVAFQVPRRAAEVARIVRRDAPAHPSPNAGVAEAAVAAALGREVGGPLNYGKRLERRPRLGEGPRPRPGDVRRAIQISDRAELTAIVLLTFIWLIDLARRPR